MAGVHGNEPAGIRALERVMGQLNRDKAGLRGRVVALRGNLKALAQRERFLSQDLNRMWTDHRIFTARHKAPAQRHAEEQELLALLDILGELDRSQHHPKVLIDLHTTSAPGGHFSVVEKDPLSLQLADSMQAPVIMGLTRALIGTTATYCVEQGWSGLAFEAGQHHDPRATEDHAAAIWTVLSEMGMLTGGYAAEARQQQQHLRRVNQGLPGFVEVVYRHAIHQRDGFRMQPGYINFQAISAGEVLAKDQRGPIVAPFDGLMLMPLYQPRGADGFFLIQPVREEV